MELRGTQQLSQSQVEVWQALLDPAVLQRCIRGCERFERHSAERFSAVVQVSIGPVKARFSSLVTLSDIEAPRSMTLSFDGQGGIAGFGKGQAKLQLKATHLDPTPSGTTLEYTAQAMVGGRLAQLGSRLVEGAAAKLAADFFDAFNAVLREDVRKCTAVEPESPEPSTASLPLAQQSTLMRRRLAWIAGATLVVSGAAWAYFVHQS